METTRKPNLIFVFGDQHRQCDVGCAGNPQVQTPAMDKLAQEGYVLSQYLHQRPDMRAGARMSDDRQVSPESQSRLQ